MTETASAPDMTLGEVTITREFNAPRELIFRALVEPEQLIKFWGPVGTHVPLESVIIEPWAGGRFENTMVADDGSGEFPMRAIFVEVVEPERLVFTELDSGLTSTGTLTDLGGGRTLMVIHQTNVPEMYRSPEAIAGFNTSLDQLAEHLATLTA
jgi:uncharacterized protein YndB with AHSA1/START domain